MPATPAEIIRTWFERVWIAGDTDAIARMAHPEVRIQGLGASTENVAGAEAFRAFYDGMHTAFSGFDFTLHDVIGGERTAAARWTMRLRHTGDGMGVPATGKELAVTGMTFIEVRDGRIIGGWNEWDRVTLARTIGAQIPG